MRVLVACEYSGRVRDAFRALGHDAVSCDLLPTEQLGPHVQGDVRAMLREPWDMVIAHPPCTYLSRAGARWLHAGGKLCPKRMVKLNAARELFFECLSANSPRVCVENPIPLRAAGLPPHSQAIQPYEFGHPYSKKTLLWLRGLPPLMATVIVENYVPFLPSNTGAKKRGGKSSQGIARTAKDSSRTFEGVAAAMAAQWGGAAEAAA